MADEEASAIYPLPAYDLHLHSVYCGHAAEDATIENIVARAQQLRLEYVGISEHVCFPEEAASLFQIDRDIRQHPSPTTRVLLGVEVDPNPLKADGTWVTHDLHVDYIILSPHRLPHLGIGAVELEQLRLSELERDTLGAGWLEWYGRCIEHGGMDILGHPLREPMALGLLSLLNKTTLRQATDVLALAARGHIAFELNDAWLGALALTPQFEPYMEMLQELHRQGMRFSRGSDAHSPGNVGNCRQIAYVAKQLELQEQDWLRPGDFGKPPDWEV